MKCCNLSSWEWLTSRCSVLCPDVGLFCSFLCVLALFSSQAAVSFFSENKLVSREVEVKTFLGIF